MPYDPRRNERRQYLLGDIRDNPTRNNEMAWREISRLDDDDSGESSRPHMGPAKDPRWDAYFSALKYAGGNAPEGDANVDVNNWMGPNSESEAYKTTSTGDYRRPRGRNQKYSLMGLQQAGRY